MSGQMTPYDPWGGGDGYGGRGRYIRSRPVGLKAVAAISTAQWVGKRVATRLTPIWLILLWVLGIPLAFYTDLEVIIVLGVCGVIITYATQRHVSMDERTARQWALRACILPISGTAWVTLWWAMHRVRWDVINKRMILGFLLYGCLLWSWLYLSRFVGGKVAWERAQRDFAPVARRIGLAGAAIVETTKTAVGTKRVIDVRGTGQTPAAIARNSAVADLLAGHEGLAPGKVRTQASATHAGYLEVSTWQSNPWARPIPHPGAPRFARVPGRSPIGPFVIGRDPEIDKDLTIEIINDDGGVHWVIIAGTRGGKTNLLNVIVEHLTDCLDPQGRRLVRITMIDLLKGMKDAANWAPSVFRVHGGPKAVHGALASLQRLVDLIAERAEANGRRGRSKHVPTAEEPIEIVFIDEASSLLNKRSPEGRRAVELVNTILRAGASEYVIAVISAQRAVLEHLGGGDVKANAFGVAVLPVRRSLEQTLIIPDWRDRGMPDMNKYGDGAKGTVLLLLNDEWSAGRVYELHDMLTVRQIANQRVLPEHAEKLAAAQASTRPDAGNLSIEDQLMTLGLPPDSAARLASGRRPDAPDGLDFDAGPSEVLPPGRPDARPGDRPAPASGRPGVRLTPGMVTALREIGLTPGTPEADAMLQHLIAAGVTFPEGVRASGPGAEDDEAVEAAMSGAGDAENVRPLRPDAPPWVDVDDSDAPEGDDPVEEMGAQIDRLCGVAAWAAAKERDRTPEEAAELHEAWMRHTWQVDQAVALPERVNAVLSALARARGPAGFTREDAREALQLAEASTGKETINGYLRVLVNQGHLERLRGAAPGRGGGDLYRLGARHRKQA